MAEYRLPTNVKPTHYDITIKTDLDELKFEGFATIDLEVVEETSTVVFNSSGLDLKDITLHSESLKTEQLQIAQNIDEASERVTVKFSSTLPAKSKAQLRLGFSAALTGSMAGYYFSQTEIDGKKVHYALTQFEPTAARKAFPGWDEPLLKATYDITLISKENTVNLSNMPVVSEKPFAPADDGKTDTAIGKLTKLFTGLKTTESNTPTPGWKITKFERTPLISSYLVAWANGPFEHIEGKYTSPLSGKTRPVRIYGTKDIIHQTEFALDVNVRALPIYEKIFDVEYPLPKLDVLVAHDFDAGAMENWGLITGRTSAYLIDPVKSDIRAKKRVAGTASHEVAHQWFGNIVTMEWWEYLYLNEGFATLMGEVIVLDKLFPEWAASVEFIEDHWQRALELDSKRSSHPIEVPCPDANQINQIFDALSYSKAGSVLRMLSNFVGEDVFLKGVSIYLKKRLYGNSVTKDLWDGISEASGIDVNKLMSEWILKIGFPVLTVKEDGDSITVRQDRYLATGDVKDEENQTLWQVPLNLLTAGEDGKAKIDHSLILSEREKTYKVDTSKPFKLNAGTTGVYRVAYPPERLVTLGKQAAAKDSPFSLADRIGLVSDAMVLGKSGVSKTSYGLGLIDTLKNEEEHLVWSGISTALADIDNIWWEQPKSVRDNLKAFNRYLFSPLVKKLGFEYPESDSPSTRQLRTLAIGAAASAEDQEVLQELQSRFKPFVDSGDDSKIIPDIERSIFVHGVRKGGRKEWEAVRAYYAKPKTPWGRISAAIALTRTQDPELIDETFKFLLSDVKTQDMIYFFVGFNANHATRRKLLGWLKDNFAEIYKRFEGNFSLGYVIKYTLDSFASAKDLEETEEFFKGQDISKYRLPLLQSYDAIRANTAWLERSKEDVARWLEDWSAKSKL